MPELPTQEQFVRNKRGHFQRMNLVTRYYEKIFIGRKHSKHGRPCKTPEIALL